MRSAERSARRLLVISQRDVDRRAQLSLSVSSCEDCACSVTDAGAHAEPLDEMQLDLGNEYVVPSNLAVVPIDSDHFTLFNSLGSGGAVVVDRLAWGLLSGLGVRTSLAHLLYGNSNRDSLSLAQVAHLVESDILVDADRRIVGVSGSAPSSKLTAWLHVTNACNLRCDYCYINKTNEAMTPEIGRSAVDALFRSAVIHQMRTVKLKYAGGEATLNHGLVIDLHDYATDVADRTGVKLESVVLTNAVAMPTRFIEALRTRGIRVMVSLDGVGAAHDAQRRTIAGRASFRQVSRTIDRLLHFGITPHASVTVTGRNGAGVRDAVRFCLDRGMTFSLNLYRDNDCSTVYDDLQLADRAVIDSMHSAFDEIEQSLPPWSVLGCVLDRGQLLQPRQKSCGVGDDYVVIDQRGDVAKCHMEIEQTLGSVADGDPLSLVRSTRGTVLNLLVDEKEGCRDCTWRYWCSGGCSLATFRATGRFDVKSPNCNIYKAIYPAALRLEGLRLMHFYRRSAPVEPCD